MAEKHPLTEYIVLKADEEHNGSGPFPYPKLSIYNPADSEGRPQTVKAHTRVAAIKELTEGMSDEERTGVFIAVPARSFQPVNREVRMEPVDRITEGKL